jgi:F-type H+-transporting ATPase subunit alpha
MRLDLAQYREMAAFAQFGSDLDKQTQAQLARGERMMEILKQPQYQPLPVEKQIVLIYAGTAGYLDTVPVAQIVRYEVELYRYVDERHPDLLTTIAAEKTISDKTKAELQTALKDFGELFAKMS